MPIKIKKTKENIVNVKLLIYGEAGIGKTRMVSTAPNPLLISSEKGLMSLKDEDIDYINITSLQDIEDTYNYLVSDSESLNKYDTYCLDSISDLAEIILHEFMENERDGRNAYGKLGNIGLDLLRRFRDISSKHLYFIAKMVREEDEYTGIPTWRPYMPGKTLINSLPHMFDILAPLRKNETEDKKIIYTYLQIKPDIQFMSKDRSNKLDEIEEPNLTKIFNKILLNGEK